MEQIAELHLTEEIVHRGVFAASASADRADLTPNPFQEPDCFNRIFQGDCIKMLNRLPANSVDMIFADPPYNLQLKQELHRPNMTRVASTVNDWDQFASFEEYDRFTKSWLSACRRVLKETGTIWVSGSYHNIYRVGTAMLDTGFWILNDVVWQKTNPMPNFRGVRFTNAHETVIWAQKNKGAKYTFNYRTMKNVNGGSQMRSVWDLPLCTGKERLKVDGVKAHPTQKPEALLYRIILSSTETNAVVLDPFFGTGTTGAVAKRLGRRWIGIEMDANYINLAQQRIDNVMPQMVIDGLDDLEANKALHKVPFGRLLELGLLHPGQTLTLRSKKREGTILPDGRIQADSLIGSIHKVGSAIVGAPCNGWITWEYIDEETGNSCIIDNLRKEARRIIAAELNAEED